MARCHAEEGRERGYSEVKLGMGIVKVSHLHPDGRVRCASDALEFGLIDVSAAVGVERVKQGPELRRPRLARGLGKWAGAGGGGGEVRREGEGKG